MTTRFCIVRHGETDWNTERRIQGHVDIPLNAAGIEQAVATSRGIAQHRFAAVYSSDLRRTLQTAHTVASAAGLDVRPLPGLRERHYGAVQGMTYDELLARDPDMAQRFRARDPHFDFAGGETLLGFVERVQSAIAALAQQHAGDAVLLVTHGGVLDVIYRRAVGRDLTSPRDFPVPNAALNWIEAEGDAFRLLSWADTRHLDHTLVQSPE